jgi:hypothetical protein
MSEESGSVGLWVSLAQVQQNVNSGMGGLYGHGRVTGSTLCGSAIIGAGAGNTGWTVYACTSAGAIYRTDGASLPEPAFEDAGIRAGEVEAWRAWVVQDGVLQSMAFNIAWPFDGLMTGKPTKWGEGVHAYKTAQLVVDNYGANSALVIGRVKLWGEIYEHELGYRAEFARIIAIDSVDISHLRRRQRLRRRRRLLLLGWQWEMWPHDAEDFALRELREAYGLPADGTPRP